MATDQSPGDIPFWRRKSLEEMTDSEWESLCDGCGRCCLNKLEEEGTDRTYYTDVGCRLLDGDTCRCRDYPHRLEKVEDCVQLTPESLKTITWLPPSCAYVLACRRQGPLLVASAGLRRSRERPCRGRLGARPRRRKRDGRTRRRPRRPHRELAVAAAEGGAAAVARRTRLWFGVSSSTSSLARGCRIRRRNGVDNQASGSRVSE